MLSVAILSNDSILSHQNVGRLENETFDTIFYVEWPFSHEKKSESLYVFFITKSRKRFSFFNSPIHRRPVESLQKIDNFRPFFKASFSKLTSDKK